MGGCRNGGQAAGGGAGTQAGGAMLSWLAAENHRPG